MTIQTILDHLWTLAPVEYRMPWDNVGLLLGRRDREVSDVLVALDATPAVAEEAEALGCGLVVTHHPVIFHPEKHITDADPATAELLCFLERGIGVISMHTNLDCAPGGVNDVLAARLELGNVEVLGVPGEPGLIRMGEVEPTSLPEFCAFVKQALACPGLRYADGGKSVRRVAVGGGACGDYISRVAAAGCDTFVTADLKYHQFQEAARRGLNLIDAGHFETENPVCAAVAQALEGQFPQLRVHLSRHSDCIGYF